MKFHEIGLGLTLALCAILGLHWPLESEAQNGLALFLALTACVYPGALLAQQATGAVAAQELGVGAAVFACAWLGVAAHPGWLAAGYVLHGAWDWAHHRAPLGARIAVWFPPLCAAFDVAVGGYAAWLAYCAA